MIDNFTKTIDIMKEIIRGSVKYQINPNNAQLLEFIATVGTKSYMVRSGGLNLELTEQEYNNFKS